MIVLLFFILWQFTFITGCGTNEEVGESLAFNDLSEYKNGKRVLSEKALSLDGQLVTIAGWISPMSPLGGDIFYLISVPGAECPFCAGETVDYFDFIIVNLGEQFPFTYDPIYVTGIFEIEEARPVDYEAYEHDRESDYEYEIFLKIKDVESLKEF